MIRQLRQGGYTLIELLLYIALIGALLTGVVFFFSITLDARAKNQSISEVNDQGAIIMQTIVQTIHNATSVSSPAAGASGASLTLVVPTGSLSPTVFDLSSSIIRIKEGAGAVVALSNDNVQVTSLTFRNLTKTGTTGQVQVSFTLSRVNASSRNEYDYQKTFVSSAEIGL